MLTKFINYQYKNGSLLKYLIFFTVLHWHSELFNFLVPRWSSQVSIILDQPLWKSCSERYLLNAKILSISKKLNKFQFPPKNLNIPVLFQMVYSGSRNWKNRCITRELKMLLKWRLNLTVPCWNQLCDNLVRFFRVDQKREKCNDTDFFAITILLP